MSIVEATEIDQLVSEDDSRTECVWTNEEKDEILPPPYVDDRTKLSDAGSSTSKQSSSDSLPLKETILIDEKPIRNGLDKSTDGVTMSFHNIRYEVKTPVDDVPMFGKKVKKDILHGISGYFPPGLNAIMGPTGSGKTSLLDILAQRKDPAGLKEGHVSLDGERVPKAFRLMSGYVVQDDMVMGTLTVRENITFSANLRLSDDEYTPEEKTEKVNQVIEELGLQACADTPIGTDFMRGVSGGERKRANIGMELILDPPVLFLDEPTSGLDANTANTIILLLYKIASGGRNIILSIHQPRYSIFVLFDRLILLNKGHIVYRGPAQTAVEYFEEIGYKCPQYHNPPDYFLDILGGDVNTAELISRFSEESKNILSENRKEIDAVLNADEKLDNCQSLVDAFSNSELNKREMKEIESIDKYNSSDSSLVIESCCDKMDLPYANEFPRQMRHVMRRTVTNVLRDPMTFTGQMFMSIFLGLTIGGIYYQIGTDYPSGVQNRSGIFFFLVTGQVMSNLSSLAVFITNRKFFVHESASGYYRASVFFISQVCCDLIPNRLIPSIFFTVIVYFMVGFQLVVEKFFIFLLITNLTMMSACSVAFWVSAAVPNFAVANVAVSLPYILMMLFGGFLANIETILPWLAWMKWLSIFRYGINALSVNEMTGLELHGNVTVEVWGFNVTTTMTYTGDDYFTDQGIPSGPWGLWQNIVAMFSITLAFFILSYIQLRRINKYK